MSKRKRKEYPWAQVFMELALRAMRRVHYEYGIWNVGACKEVHSRDVARLNRGRGIELADERTVCAAITQEFLGSRLTSGPWQKDGMPKLETRVFTLEQEKTYCNSKKRVDLFCRKLVWEPNVDDWRPFRYPSFIEAKRARLYRPDLPKKTVRVGEWQHASVAKDAIRLIEEKKRRHDMKPYSPNEMIYCHLLIWGVYVRGGSSHNSPKHFLRRVQKALTIKGQQAITLDKHAERWLPLDWSVNGTRLSVARSLWIILVEVL